MNLAELHRKLIAAARATPPDDRVPYAFEKRIMARLTGRSPLDAAALWGRALLRAAVLCLAFMVFLALGSLFLPSNNPDTLLSQDVEQTLFAAVDNPNDPAGDNR